MQNPSVKLTLSFKIPLLSFLLQAKSLSLAIKLYLNEYFERGGGGETVLRLILLMELKHLITKTWGIPRRLVNSQE